MANPKHKTIKSINIGVVKNTSNDGTHDKGYVFGQGGQICSSATNGRILTVVGSTADVTASWTLTLVVPENMMFRRTNSVSTSSGGELNTNDYSHSTDVDGNTTITFVANARDGGTSGTDPIANGEDVTIVWQTFDNQTFNATMFSVKCQSNNSGHTATIKARYIEGGTLHTFDLFSGDSLSGPFAELEVDALSNAAASCFVYYQEH